jgi:hypothetical protein
MRNSPAREVEEHRMPSLKEYLIGDLGPARRHLYRIAMGELQPVPGVLDEIAASIERCVRRIEETIPDVTDEEVKRSIAELQATVKKIGKRDP